MTPASIAVAFGVSERTASLMLASKPGDFLYAIWELGPIRCHCRRRQWFLDQRRARPGEIDAAWERLRLRKQRCA